MNRTLFVGSLPYRTTEDELREFFSAIGTVEKVRIITDRDTGRARGFAFVEMATEADAQQAIERFNEAEFGGRRLIVNVAKPKEDEGGPRDKRYDESRRDRKTRHDHRNGRDSRW